MIAVVVAILVFVSVTYFLMRDGKTSIHTEMVSDVSGMTETVEMDGSQLEYVNAKQGAVDIVLPKPGSKVSGDFMIRGFIEKSWAIDGEIPLLVYDAQNTLLFEGSAMVVKAEAVGEKVEFEGSVLLSPSYVGAAHIVLIDGSKFSGDRLDTFATYPVVVSP
jgi:hypothetical protein